MMEFAIAHTHTQDIGPLHHNDVGIRKVCRSVCGSCAQVCRHWRPV